MDPRETFCVLESQIFKHYELAPHTYYLDLPEPRVRVRVLEFGVGEPVILLHGNADIAARWAPLIARVNGWRLIAVERPGCGLSEPYDYKGVELRAHAARFLYSLLDALNIEQAPFIANSMGGLWAMFFALHHPERVHSLALLGSPSLFPDTEAPLWLRMMSLPPVARAIEKLAANDRLFNDKLFKRFYTQLAGYNVGDAEIQLAKAALQLPGVITSLSSLLETVLTPFGTRPEKVISRSELGRIQQASLIIWGCCDYFADIKAIRRGSNAMPNAHLAVVDAAHLPWIDEPWLCAKIVAKFLTEHGYTPAYASGALAAEYQHIGTS